MSAEKKTKQEVKRPSKYEKPLVVNGTFMDVIGAAIKQAEKKMGKK